MIDKIKKMVKKNNIAYLVTKGSYPRISPEIYFYERGKFIITSSVVFSEKLNNIKINSKVTLLVSDKGGELVINGKAKLIDEDLENSWINFRDEWFSMDNFAARLYETRDFLPQFWKRILIVITPERIILNPSTDNYILDLEVL